MCGAHPVCIEGSTDSMWYVARMPSALKDFHSQDVVYGAHPVCTEGLKFIEDTPAATARKNRTNIRTLKPDKLYKRHLNTAKEAKSH